VTGDVGKSEGNGVVGERVGVLVGEVMVGEWVGLVTGMGDGKLLGDVEGIPELGK